MIDTGAGVVDGDYRGIVNVLLYNLSDKDFQGNLFVDHLISQTNKNNSGRRRPSGPAHN